MESSKNLRSRLYFPTMRQLVTATIVGIASHPKIKNPGIYYPVQVVGRPKQEVKISSYRNYGGIELLDSGLTCSVYPMHTSRNSIDGTPNMPTSSAEHSVIYKPMVMGGRYDATSQDHALYRLIVELAYQDADFDSRIDVPYLYNDTKEIQISNHAYNQQVQLGTFDQAKEDYQQNPFFDKFHDHLRSEQVTIRTSVGEALLREYIDLVRLVLVDLPTLRPYAVRSTQVVAADYSTTNWLNRSQNINFHTAYLIWELCLYPPNSWRDIFFQDVKTVNIKTQKSHFYNSYRTHDPLFQSPGCPVVLFNPMLPNFAVIKGTYILPPTIPDPHDNHFEYVITQQNLNTGGLYVLSHNLNLSQFADVYITDSNGQRIMPDQVLTVDSMTIQIDMSSYQPLVGSYVVSLVI